MERLFFISILALMASGYTYPAADCINMDDAVEITTAEDLVLKTGFTFTVPTAHYCYHECLLDFQIEYTLGVGDADT